MSSTATTQYYGLTQYIGTDKPDFADNNSAFRNVDADLHQVVQDSQGFTSDIADLTERVGNLDTDLTNLSGDLDGEKAKITALQNKELSQDTEISRVERNGQDMITAYNEASATSTHAYAVGDYFIYNNVLYQATAAIAVGATIVPDTNCTTTNVASELIQLNNELTDTLKMEGIVENFSMGTADSWTAVSDREYDLSAFKWIGAKIHHPDVSMASSPFNFISVDDFKNSSPSRTFFAYADETALISMNGDSSKSVLVAYDNTTHKISYYRGSNVNSNVRLLIVGVK